MLDIGKMNAEMERLNKELDIELPSSRILEILGRLQQLNNILMFHSKLTRRMH